MKLIYLLIGLFLSIKSFGIEDISPKDAFKNFNDKKAVIIDVREPKEFAEGNIKYSINIPLSLMEHNRNEFEHLVDRLPKGQDIILYCRSGRRSKVVGEELEKRKLKIYNLGSFDSWKKAGLPVEIGVSNDNRKSN